MPKTKCSLCGKSINRPIHKGCKNAFCNRECAGLYKRKYESDEDFKERKRLYDMEYRKKNMEIIKKKKSEYFKRTYDPKKAAIERKKKMARHVEYCRSPEYKKWKKKYDNKYRAHKYYGDFGECLNLLCELENEIRKRIPDKYERLKMRGLLERIRDKKHSKKGLKI